MSAGECQTGNKNDYDDVSRTNRTCCRHSANDTHGVVLTLETIPTPSTPQEEKEGSPPPLDETDIALLKSYGLGPYSVAIKTLEEEIKTHQQTVKDLIGIKESDTGLSQPSQWDLVGDKQMMSEEAPLQVASLQIHQ